jgi:hypothetical protein
MDLKSDKKVEKEVFLPFIQISMINSIISSHTFQYPFFHLFHRFSVFTLRPPFFSPLSPGSRRKAGLTKTLGLNSRFFSDLIAMNSLNLYRSLGFLTCQSEHVDVVTHYFIFIQYQWTVHVHI